VKGLVSESLRSTGEFLEVLDQRQLPQAEVWLTIGNVDDMIVAIKGLAIRGAPAIGVGAALALAQSAMHGTKLETLKEESARLREARPTAVNLMRALDVMNEVLEKSFSPESLVQTARAFFDQDVEMCERIAANGVGLFKANEGILTHCNTGGLATVGRGTAFAVFRAVHEKGLNPHIYVDETRPLLQGARLTAWECARHGIKHTLITDNMAAWQMAQGRIHKVIVGSDRIAMNGDFANKIGTYGLAVLCHYHRIPFYVAAPLTTVDPETENGGDIHIEQRLPAEVHGASGTFGNVQWATASTKVDNPAFDVTPHELVSGWILDTGFYTGKDIKAGVLRQLTQGSK
jgi:methylthioribose-1-phosphate isomerase